MALMSSSSKPDRQRVDLSTSDLVRQWCKHFGLSKADSEEAIAKVGDNAETVMKELCCKRSGAAWDSSMKASLASSSS